MKGGRFVEQGGKTTTTIAKQMICQQFDGSDLADLRLAMDPAVMNLCDRLVLINGAQGRVPVARRACKFVLCKSNRQPCHIHKGRYSLFPYH